VILIIIANHKNLRRNQTKSLELVTRVEFNFQTFVVRINILFYAAPN